MRLFNLFLLSKLFILTLLIAPNVYSSDEKKLYIGLSAGSVEYDIDADLDDDDDNGWKLFAGYNINDIFSVEAGYMDLGTLEYLGYDFDYTSIYLTGVASWPVHDLIDIYGKLGFHRWDSDVDDGLDDDGFDLMGGLGVQINPLDYLGLRVEYEYLAGDSDSIRLLSGGLVFSF